MIDSLYIAATGMHAQQTNVETISNNLANLNTTAFKRGRVSFEDLMYREVARARGPLGSNADVLRNGAGVSLAASSKSFEQGDFKKTDQPYDVAIRGSGLFEVLMPDGTHAFTRNGGFHVDHDGDIPAFTCCTRVVDGFVDQDAEVEGFMLRLDNTRQSVGQHHLVHQLAKPSKVSIQDRLESLVRGSKAKRRGSRASRHERVPQLMGHEGDVPSRLAP